MPNFPDSFKNTIQNANCLDVLRNLPDKSVDLIVTSPPYNIGKEYESKKALSLYLEFQSKVITECCRVLADTGSIYWQVGSFVDQGAHYPLDVKLFPFFERLNMIPRNRIVWLRTHGLHAKNRFSCRHETILWFTKTDKYKFNLDPIRVPQKYPNKKAWTGSNKGELTCDPLGKNPGDVWAFRNVKHNHEEQTIHPCQFPEDMIERIILSSSENGDIVFDPYMGVGTVAKVAKDLNRIYFGTELDKDYFDVSLHRLSGDPDEKGNFPNLKCLRSYCAQKGIENPGKFSFTKQVGKEPTLGNKSKIFPEEVHLERFYEHAWDDQDNSAYKRGLVSDNNKVIKIPQITKSGKQLGIFDVSEDKG